MDKKDVPFLNLTALNAECRPEILQALAGMIDRSEFIEGPAVHAFEKSFAEWVGGGQHCVGCANGTDAITLAAKGLNLPPGSEAIVPAMTFIATVEGLMNAGLTIKLVDIDPKTWLLDPRGLKDAVTSKTRLIAPVHLYGQMAAMDEISLIAKKAGCAVLEDAAQAHGSTWKGKPVGHWGDVVTFSFYPGKNLGAFGDAGALMSRDRNLAERCSALGKHGGLKKYEHTYLGCNSRLDAFQAAILNVKLKHVDKWNNARRRIAATYLERLGGIDGLTLPTEAPEARHIYHLYVVQVKDRADFAQFLTGRGVSSAIHYPKAIHQQPCFTGEPFARQRFPNAERLAGCGVSLPMCPTLTEAQVDWVCKTVRAYFER